MINKRLLEIDDCENCIHIFYEDDTYCDLTKKAIPWDGDAVPIPEWCPLEDKCYGCSQPELKGVVRIVDWPN